jgi:cell division septal protein FtsQ
MFGRRKNRKKRGPLSSYKGKFARAAKIMVLAVTLPGAVYLGRGLYIALSRSPYLEIKNIEIKGAKMVSAEEVIELTGIRSGNNILTVNTFRAEKALGGHPYVEDAAVHLSLPDKVVVKLTEREPFLIVNLEGLYLMDRKGVIFKKYTESLELPVVTGMDGFEDERRLKGELFALISTLDESEIFKPARLSEIHLSAHSGFAIITAEDGVRVEFGSGQFEEKIKRLTKVVEAMGGLRGVESIDLTGLRGVVVRFAALSGQRGA